MREAQPTPDLQSLDDAYDILGELRIGDQTRMYLARRKETQQDVVISVVESPAGGENNALALFAADTQLLSTLDHPQVPHVIEGRWVGKDQLAVVTVRRPATTLGERLARGERFTPPRIATILHEVSAVLEWAQTNGVVHRGVSVDTLAFEQGSNRVLVSLAPTPISITGVPDAAADARTIGALAWAMLTGEPRTDARPLAEVRPDLAKRVLDATDAIVSSTDATRADVPAYLAIVAAADALKAGELEIAEIEAGILEARRAELAAFEEEKAENARRARELEAQLANERAEFTRRMEAEQAELSSVKTQFAALKAHEESQIESERRQLDAERAEYDAHAAELETRRVELDRKADEIAAVRAEEGKRIDAAIADAVETVAVTAAQAEAARLQDAHVDVSRLASDSDSANADAAAAVAATRDAAAQAWMAETVRRHAVGTGELTESAHRARRLPRWVIPTVAAVGIIGATLVAGYLQREDAAPERVKVGNEVVVPTPPASEGARTPRGGFLTQSAGGLVAPPVGAPVAPPVASPAAAATAAPVAVPSGATPPAAPATPADSARLDSAVAARRAAAARQRARQATADSTRSVTSFSVEADAIARADSIRRDSIARARRDSISRVRRDSISRATARRDSIARAAARRDTLPQARPDPLR